MRYRKTVILWALTYVVVLGLVLDVSSHADCVRGYEGVDAGMDFVVYGGAYGTPIEPGECDSCWAFSTLGSMDAAYHMGQSKPVTLASEIDMLSSILYLTVVVQGIVVGAALVVMLLIFYPLMKAGGLIKRGFGTFIVLLTLIGFVVAQSDCADSAPPGALFPVQSGVGCPPECICACIPPL